MQLAGNPAEILLTQQFEAAFALSLNAEDHYFSGFASEDILWTTKSDFQKRYHCLIKLNITLDYQVKGFYCQFLIKQYYTQIICAIEASGGRILGC